MVDFSNIAAYEQNADPRPFVIVQIDNGEQGSPVLMVRPATEANEAYYNDWLRRIAERRTSGKRAKEASKDLTRASREEDRELIGLHCLTGWSNVLDVNGKQVEFTPENGMAFLKALPDWIFDDLRTWAMNPASFVRGPVSPADASALGN